MKRFAPFWGGRPVDWLARVLRTLGTWIFDVGFAIEHRGLCHQCGDFSPHGKFCSKHQASTRTYQKVVQW